MPPRGEQRSTEFSTEFKKGIVPWNKGKKMTQDLCKKLSESHKGFKVSNETKIKISQTSKGLIVGKDRYNACPVACYDINGNFIERFDTLKQAGEKYRVAPNNIAKAIKKNSKCKSLYWRKEKKL